MSYRDDLACEHIIDRMHRGQFAIVEKNAGIRYTIHHAFMWEDEVNKYS